MFASFRMKITPPGSEGTEVVVKRSVLIRLEEELGVPILARIGEGYTGGLFRLGYAVGRDAGIIPAGLSFDEFVDAEDEWGITFVGSQDAESADPND